MKDTNITRTQEQTAVYENRKALKALGLTLPSRKADFDKLSDDEISALYQEIPATESSVDDVDVAEITGVSKHTSKAGETYYTTPCKFLEFRGATAYFEIVHGTHAGRQMSVPFDKDLYLLNKKSPIPAGTEMNFGYTHGKEPFVFIKDSTVTANSVLVANNEDRINYPSLGRLIKSLSPELFGQSIELANAQRDAEKVAIFESAIINNVSVRDLRTQLKEQNMQDALADVKKAQKASIANLLGK